MEYNMEVEIKQQREKLKALYDRQQQLLNTVMHAKLNGQLSVKGGDDVLSSPEYLALQKEIGQENKILQDQIKESDSRRKNAVAAKQRYWQEKSSEALEGLEASIQTKEIAFKTASALHSEISSKIAAIVCGFFEYAYHQQWDFAPMLFNRERMMAETAIGIASEDDQANENAATVREFLNHLFTYDPKP